LAALGGGEEAGEEKIRTAVFRDSMTWEKGRLGEKRGR